jgi:uncharacterized protein (UPF0548 family)
LYRLFLPDSTELLRFAKEARQRPLSTPKDPLREEPQSSWNEDHYRREIALPMRYSSSSVRQSIEQMLRECAFFPSWMVALRLDDIVVVGAKVFGVYGVFADRIIEEHSLGDEERFDLGFTYATVQGHFETGIESFRATRSGALAPVVFEIHAVSRAANVLKAALSIVVVRSLQRRFGRDTPLRFEEVLRQRLSARE